jgi:hypothetical protein
LSTGADWRRVLIYTHRWLGIAGCLVFLVWFVSGIVMMYERMPRLTAEERLSRLEPLDPSRLRIPLETAARAANVTPDRVRVGMLGDRPVYRLKAAGRWTTVFADTGELFGELSAREAIAMVRRFVPEHAATVGDASRLEQPDQWTLDGGLPRFLPMQRVAIGDSAGTDLYVSGRTGDVVMKTTARGRAWGYVGSVLHWTYFTPFRQHRELWRYSIIYVALGGCVMCLSGLVVGVWRFSPAKRFRLKRERSHSPYAGLMWWHHYAGLLFGLFSFTWALSGALSLTPWDWAPSTAPNPQQLSAVTGGPLRLDRVTPDRLRSAVAAIATSFNPKELEILQFKGEPFVMAYRPPAASESSRWTNPDVSAFDSSTLAIEHRLVWADAPERGTFTRVPDEAFSEVAERSMPGVAIEDAEWLDAPDNYYYDRWTTPSLPVLRVRYADPQHTWLYFDPQHGQIVLKEVRLTRANRWLYNGLHSLDLPFLYPRRPAWDIVVLLLSLGGIALSVTTMWPAWRRLRRRARERLPRVRWSMSRGTGSNERS